MNERPRTEPPLSESDQGTAKPVGPAVPAVKLPPSSSSMLPAANDAAAQKELTEDEQMALYEKDLKDNDWGHRPC